MKNFKNSPLLYALEHLKTNPDFWKSKIGILSPMASVGYKVVLITINSMDSDALIGPMKKTKEIGICIVCSGPMRASDSY